jgi:hypothetical protein
MAYRVSRWLGLAWAVIAVTLICGANTHSHLAFLCAIAVSLWTIPFSLVWQISLLPIAERFLPVTAVDWVGATLVICLDYMLWFVALPWLIAIVGKSRRRNRRL